MFGISNLDFQKSLGPEQMIMNLMKGNIKTLNELSSSGRSGSFLYFSMDNKFILKTITDNEFQFLSSILTSYYHYIKSNPNTLITRIFGLYQMDY